MAVEAWRTLSGVRREREREIEIERERERERAECLLGRGECLMFRLIGLYLEPGSVKLSGAMGGTLPQFLLLPFGNYVWQLCCQSLQAVLL